MLRYKRSLEIPAELVPSTRYGKHQGVFLIFIEGASRSEIDRKARVIQRTIKRLRLEHAAWRRQTKDKKWPKV